MTFGNCVPEVIVFSTSIMTTVALFFFIVFVRKRNELGLSQRELASLCDIPQSSVARIESFQTTPNLATLLKLFRVLGLKISVTK